MKLASGKPARTGTAATFFSGREQSKRTAFKADSHPTIQAHRSHHFTATWQRVTKHTDPCLAGFFQVSVERGKVTPKSGVIGVGGADQFLAGSGGWACGKSRDQRPLRQKVSRHINASSPVWLQNWPVRLNRAWY